MIKDEAFGGGHRWYCDKCDVYHNGYLNVISWTNSTPPQYCVKCEKPYVKHQKAMQAACRVVDRLQEIYGHRFCTPGHTRTIAGLIKEHALQGRYNAHLLAAIINQSRKASV